MEWLKELWKFLSVEENREILYFIGGVMAALAVAIWQIYVHFSEKKASDGLTEEKFVALLKQRDEEISKEVSASAPGSEQRALLEKQLTALEQQRTHLEESLQATRKVYADTIQLLEKKLSAQLPPKQIEQAKTAIAKGDPSLAESLLRKVVDLGVQLAAEASYQLGLLAKNRVDFVAAWNALTKAAQLAPDNPLYLNGAGLMAHTLGRYDTAIEYFDKALAIDLKAQGPEHPDVANRWNNLGGAWHYKGDYDKAIEYYEKALSSDLKTFGPEHPDVANRWNSLGGAWEGKGEYDKAIEYYEKALAINLKTFGPDHPDAANLWNNLGYAWYEKGEYDKAIEYLEKALASNLKTLGPEHPHVATLWNNLGLALKAKGEVDRPIQYYEKALAINLKTLGPEHPHVATLFPAACLARAPLDPKLSSTCPTIPWA